MSVTLVKWSSAFVGSAALLSASLLNFLVFNEYPLLGVDVVLVIAGLVSIAAVFAGIYVPMSRLGNALMEALLIACIVDLNADKVIFAVIAGIAVFAVSYITRNSLLKFFALIGAFVILTTLLGFSPRKHWITTEHAPRATRPSANVGPAIVHLILDEHIGIEGIPQTTPEGRALKTDLRHFYQSRGFVVFGRAYSEHMHTVNAIPHILNYGAKIGDKSSKTGVTVGRTAHFEGLRKRGYMFHVLQSDFADLCSGIKPASCTTYYSPSLTPIPSLNIDNTDRARLIIFKFLALTSWAKRIFGVIDLDEQSLTSSVPAFFAFSEFEREVSKAKPGEVYLAHFLIPHYPYVLDRYCNFRPRSQWLHRKKPRELTIRQRAYFEQLRCVTRKLDLVLNALSKSPAGANAVVIIHGDHGSRITGVDPKDDNAGQYTKEDVIAGFSTLFVVRGPATEPVYYEYPETAAGLLRDFTHAGFKTPSVRQAASTQTVVVDDWNWQPKARINLPAEW